ncbi:hypothetical protein [Echinimonas agarilytica]|uniref:Uncharacterized protein n=1 Tax=Echinimonas agarilytica TaxID=1215918 RepID=A0AA41W4H1_9GAMM|nr:hypothetical protein [Echinimonas agarilytica]MCM2678747.1 hypothetical protein [Echinimonas agarilytica]
MKARTLASSRYKALSDVFSDSLPQFGDALKNYKSQFINVNASVISLLNCDEHIHENKATERAFSRARSALKQWSENSLSGLWEISDSAHRFHPLVRQHLVSAKAHASDLIENPTHEMTLKNLAQNISNISQPIGAVIEHFQKSLNSTMLHQRVLTAELSELKSQLSIELLMEECDVLKSIQSFKTRIQNSAQVTQQIQLENSDSAVLGKISILEGHLQQEAPGIVICCSIGGAEYPIRLDSEHLLDQIEAIEDKVLAATPQMMQQTQWHILGDTYLNLINEISILQLYLNQCYELWLALENDMLEALEHIEHLTQRKGSRDYCKIFSYLLDALAEWDQAFEYCGSIHINLQFSHAPLNIGLSETRAIAAMNSHEVSHVSSQYITHQSRLNSIDVKTVSYLQDVTHLQK